MYPERYEPGQEPYVIPEQVVQPAPQPQSPPTDLAPYRDYKLGLFFGRLLWFLVGAGSFAAIWLLLIGTLGTVTGIPALDMCLLFAGIAIFFCGDILTDFNRRWAEKYCGQWFRKGGK